MKTTLFMACIAALSVAPIHADPTKTIPLPSTATSLRLTPRVYVARHRDLYSLSYFSNKIAWGRHKPAPSRNALMDWKHVETFDLKDRFVTYPGYYICGYGALKPQINLFPRFSFDTKIVIVRTFVASEFAESQFPPLMRAKMPQMKNALEQVPPLVEMVG